MDALHNYKTLAVDLSTRTEILWRDADAETAADVRRVAQWAEFQRSRDNGLWVPTRQYR
jgi:hypothetical protein